MSTSEARAVTRIPLSRIHVGPDRPRRAFAEDSIAALAESIRLHGLLSPLLVRRLEGGDYRLIAGERRLRALALLGRGTADAIVLSGSACDCALIALVENLQREALHYLDVAAACRAILDRHPITQERLAASLSVSPSALANRLRLLKLSPRVREAVRLGGLTERHARALLALEDEAVQLEIARQIAEEKLSVKQAEARVAQRLHPRPRQQISPVVRDHRVILNAVMEPVRELTRIGIPLKSRVDEHADRIEVVITLPLRQA